MSPISSKSGVHSVKLYSLALAAQQVQSVVVNCGGRHLVAQWHRIGSTKLARLRVVDGEVAVAFASRTHKKGAAAFR